MSSLNRSSTVRERTSRYRGERRWTAETSPCTSRLIIPTSLRTTGGPPHDLLGHSPTQRRGCLAPRYPANLRDLVPDDGRATSCPTLPQSTQHRRCIGHGPESRCKADTHTPSTQPLSAPNSQWTLGDNMASSCFRPCRKDCRSDDREGTIATPFLIPRSYRLLLIHVAAQRLHVCKEKRPWLSGYLRCLGK